MEQQILLQQQIKAMEEKHYAEKDWQMTGEVRASQRPKESLLETFLEYESITKRPPQVTPEKNQSLEEKIRERIRSVCGNSALIFFLLHYLTYVKNY